MGGESSDPMMHVLLFQAPSFPFTTPEFEGSFPLPPLSKPFQLRQARRIKCLQAKSAKMI
jgi:hypothetical protein